MTRREILKAAAAATAFSAARGRGIALPSEEPDTPERGIISRRPASFWEEALITGNGRMGALVMGRALDETLILSHERLFLPIHEPLPPVHAAPHLPEIRKMMAEGRWQEAADFVVELSRKEGYGWKRWTDPLFPACDVRIVSPPAGEPRNYLRSLDYATGVARTAWTDDRGSFDRRVFVSRRDNLVVVRVTGPAGTLDLDVSLQEHEHEDGGYWDPKGRHTVGIRSQRAWAEDGWLGYLGRYNLTEGGYAIAARVVTKGGTAGSTRTAIEVRGADSLVLLARVVPLKRYNGFDQQALREDIAGAGADYRALLERHSRIHGRIFSRAGLNLGATAADRAKTSEDLIESGRSGGAVAALLEKQFDQGRYAILSSCGELPPTLQGVWTGTWGPPWSSDYTQNGNVQSAMASALSGAMPECLLSYVKYLEELVPDSRENARRMYGARGIVLASRTTSHGLNNHFDRTWPMTFWTTGAGWAAQFLYDYYLHTGDRTFLRRRAWPYMTEAALFLEDFLFEGKDGKLVFSPSYSPENNPRNVDSQACVNATMDIAIARELLFNCLSAAEALEITGARPDRWRAMLAKLPAYEVNADGAVKEWTWPGIEDNYAHRHCSHLYPLFNYVPDDVESDPALLAAFRKALQLRVEERRKEPGGGVMAFGLVQLGLSAASLGDAETVSFVIDRLARNYYFEGLNTSHDPGSIFNTDLAGGLPAVIIKSLANSKPGRIDLMPAVPKQMPSGRLNGTLLRGAVTLEELEWRPGRVEATLRPRKDLDVVVRLPAGASSVRVDGKPVKPSGGRDVAVSLRAGAATTLQAEFGD